jgi:hypothetical protein
VKVAARQRFPVEDKRAVDIGTVSVRKRLAIIDIENTTGDTLFSWLVWFPRILIIQTYLEIEVDHERVRIEFH